MGFWNAPGSAEVHRALYPPDPTLAEDVRVELLLLLPKQACYRYTTSSLCGLPLKFSTPFVLRWGPWPSDPQRGFQRPFAFSVGVTRPSHVSRERPCTWWLLPDSNRGSTSYELAALTN